MSTTKVDICNAALGMLGANSITSFDEKSDRARLCVALYDKSRRALLRMHPWHCATKRTVLAAVGTPPAFGWSTAYPLPADFVRLLEISEYCYELESNQVLCNATSSVNLKYIYDNTNETTWDALLVECMGLFMASQLSKPLTGSATDGDNYFAKMQTRMKSARAVDSQEAPIAELDAGYNGLIGARYG